ncbi:unnamed protein product [Schistocephalus solidus]|uniref:Elongator complex protein 4 n=1 Tax=Schistocephalus solidus TaxID=70667 RepID=A0A183TKZ5_SCHSO|nr:unnamed protein product [Schistocephalus solidus]
MRLLEDYIGTSPYPNPPKNLAGLKKLVAQGQFVTASGIPSFDAFLVIESLASPLWGRQPESLTSCLANFLLRLRLILRDSFNVAYITLPPSVIKAVEPQTRWMTYADYAFQLDGFDGCDASVTPNPLYRDYNGLIKVIRLPSLSRFNLEPVSRPLTYDWAFKLQRRQFIVQGQLTAFYGNTLEPYMTTPVSPATNPGPSEVIPAEPCELRQIIPSPRLDEHVVYILGRDALYVYSKFGKQLAFST